jgi:hypothetical protein
MAKTQTGAQARSAAERAKESSLHIGRIRQMLRVSDHAGSKSKTRKRA